MTTPTLEGGHAFWEVAANPRMEAHGVESKRFKSQDLAWAQGLVLPNSFDQAIAVLLMSRRR
jgi:hypothetical protein